MTPALVWHDGYAAALRPGHAFPMSKYGALHALLGRRGHLPARLHAPAPVPTGLLGRVHDLSYVERVLSGTLRPEEERCIGLPGSPAVRARAALASGGTLLAARLARAEGLAVNLAGGSHHAGPDGGAGYCIFNDVAVAARALLDGGEAARILVVDLDVHQGDGTARIFGAEPAVLTLSLHAEKNFPARKARSSIDVGLPDGTGDEGYLAALDTALDAALAGPRPDIAFLNAGVDPAAGDRLGRLALSREGLLARDRAALSRLLGAGIPVAAVLGGGYGTDPAEVAERHALLFEAARMLG